MGKRKARKKNKVLPKYRSQHSNNTSIEKKIKESKIFENKDFTLVSNYSEKMSEILLDFAELTLNGVDDDDLTAMDNAIGFSAAVWNLSIMPKSEQKEALDEIIETTTHVNPEMIGNVETAIEMLLDRKKKHFDNNKRFIITYEFGMKNGEPWLDVVSTLG